MSCVALLRIHSHYIEPISPAALAARETPKSQPKQRMRQLPNVLTIGETYRHFSLASWNGFLVPANTPPEIINKLAKHVIAAARDPANVAKLTALGIEPNGTTPEQFRAQIETEQPQFNAAIKAANLKLE
jgi:tripartite-type tricarboxylate transporter receptor subunit TctC